MWNEFVRDCFRLDHPGRQQCQSPIGLPDDEVVGAGVPLDTDDGDDLAAARVKWIRDPDLKRRTPGSMTLLPPSLRRAHSCE